MGFVSQEAGEAASPAAKEAGKVVGVVSQEAGEAASPAAKEAGNTG